MPMKWIKWLYPGLNLKRWLFLFGLGTVLSCVGVTLIFNYQFVGLIEALVFNFISYVGGEFYQSTITALGLFNVVVGIFFMCYGGARVVKTVIRSVMPGEKESLRELIFTQQKLDKGPSVVVIGGGTGLSVLLRGIKLITNNCTAVVTTADDGGSSGRLRKEMGIIPPGDMRNCLVALADTEPVMERAMQYRFHDSEFLSGHSLGNLFIAAMSDLEGNMEDGLAAISEILKVHGRVWPSTSENIQLKAQMDDGSVVIGESAITASPHKIVRLMTEPENPKASQRAVDAILHADAIILGPGSLYTSVLASLIVPGIRDAVVKSKAVKIYVCNVMTQPGETDGYGAYEHVETLVNHMGAQALDYVVVNVQKAKPEQIAKYKEEGAEPVSPDIDKIEKLRIEAVPAKLLNDSDLVRHNPQKLAKCIIALIYRLRLFGRGVRFFDYFFARQTMQELRSHGKAAKNTEKES